MADRLKSHEVEGLARSMAIAPLSGDDVARLLRSHREVSRDWREVEGLLNRLAPAWAELRVILNELNRLLAEVANRHSN